MPSPREALQSFSAVIVTGGSSGIGKSFIQSAAKLQPALCFCNLSRRVPVINLPQLKLCHVGCDMGRPEAIERAAGEVEAWLKRDVPAGRVLLINNSGFGSYGRFPEPNLQHQLDLLDVNIRGLVHLTGLLLPALRARGGTVMNIASTAAFQATPFMATYGASKAFVLHWTLALAEEWKGTGLRAVAVCPGPTATEFFRRAGLKQGSVADTLSMPAEKVALGALKALGSRGSMYVPGWKNKLSAAAGSLGSKQLSAAVAGRMIGRYRLSQVNA